MTSAAIESTASSIHTPRLSFQSESANTSLLGCTLPCAAVLLSQPPQQRRTALCLRPSPLSLAARAPQQGLGQLRRGAGCWRTGPLLGDAPQEG